jgi:hypothetical protein
MRRTLIGICIIVAAIVANYVPLLNAHTEQDNCVFGPVSNAEYLAYLAQAKQQSPIANPAFFHLDDRAVGLKLNDLFETLSRDKLDIYSRIAIMHATMRSVGAVYRNTNGTDIDEGRSDPFLKAINQSGHISFQYLLDVNRLWVFSPWPRDAWVIAVLAGPRYVRPSNSLDPKKTGGIAYIFNGPTLERPLGFEVRPDGSCPPLPSADIADNFSLKP